MKKAIIIYLVLLALLIGTYKANSQTWTPNPKYVKGAKDTQPGSQVKPAKFQCWGTTTKGERCKRSVVNQHSFCYQHEKQK